MIAIQIGNRLVRASEFRTDSFHQITWEEARKLDKTRESRICGHIERIVRESTCLQGKLRGNHGKNDISKNSGQSAG